jgi:hypothetical protein
MRWILIGSFAGPGSASCAEHIVIKVVVSVIPDNIVLRMRDSISLLDLEIYV